MIEFEKALELICRYVKILESKEINLADSVGYVLAEDIYSPICMPPFNKSAMDGFAFSSEKINYSKELNVRALIQAGDNYQEDSELNSNECYKIMTGAAVPSSCDTVIQIELTDIDKREKNSKSVLFNKEIPPGMNIAKKGEDISADQKVIEKGTLLETHHLALLATVGLDKVKVHRKPKVSVINTGGEIVEPGNNLKSFQIYNANGPQFLGLLKNDNLEVDYIGIVEDNPQKIETRIKEGMKSELLLVSGGVSMGDYDFVPGTFKKLGVKEIFHTLRIKPGKPLFFGVHDEGIVMGIPGNPVSNFMAYQLFISTVIKLMSGNTRVNSLPKFGKAKLTTDFKQRPGRKNFMVSFIEKNSEGNVLATPIKSNGSADVLALTKANGVIVIDTDFVAKGSEVEYLTWLKF